MKLLLTVAIFVTSALASANPFSVQLNGSTMKVYANGRHLITWNDYQSHEIYGDIIALVDTKQVFGAFRADGGTIVNNYTKTRQYWLRPSFVAILDHDGVFDAYRVHDGHRFINTWRDVTRAEVTFDTIALLDRFGEFDAYNADGSAIVKRYKDAIEFRIMPEYVAILDKNGIFDAYRRNGTGLVRNWRDTIKYVPAYSYIALLDRVGVLQVYRVSDGFETLRQTGVQDVHHARGGVHYLQGGQWKYFPVQ